MKKIFTIRDLSQQQTHMWADQNIEDEVRACAERNITPYFFKYLPEDEDILEAGCGLGAWVIFLNDKGYRVAGIDNNREVIERLKLWNPSLNVSYGDIEHLPYEDSSLGAYISLGVIEHFEEGTERPLREAFRVLKPGGVIILTVPYNNIFRRLIAHPLRSLYLMNHRLRGRRVYFAEYRYSDTEVVNMLEKTGFHVIETGVDDFISKSRSLTIWSEFPFLRDLRKPYTLNMIGKIAAYIMNSISKKITASGILVVAKKPSALSR